MDTRLVEFRALVRLGLPLMAAQIFQMGKIVCASFLLARGLSSGCPWG